MVGIFLRFYHFSVFVAYLLVSPVTPTVRDRRPRGWNYCAYGREIQPRHEL